MRKSLRLALTRPTSLYKGGCFPQKDGRRVRVSPNKFIYTKRKSTKEKSLCFFWRRRRDSTGFQPVVFALRTVYFMSLFALQKDGRRVRVSLPFLHYTEKRYRGKSRYLFCEDRTIEMFLHFHCLDLNTRHNHSTSLRFCFQGCLQRHLDFGAADKDHLDFLF